MVSVRRCNCCGHFFDVDPQHISVLCEDCDKQQQVIRKRDLWGEEVFEEKTPIYYMPRYSGTLSAIERDGESAPEVLENKKLDRLIESAISEYKDTRQGENESIQAAFAKKEQTVSKSITRPKQVPGSKPEHNKEENLLLAELFKSGT